jgi:hypothetical protein
LSNGPAIGEWTGVTPATGATVPPYAFTSEWPVSDDEHTVKTSVIGGRDFG